MEQLKCFHEFNFIVRWTRDENTPITWYLYPPQTRLIEILPSTWYLSQEEREKEEFQRKIRKSQINTERLAVRFSVSSEIIVLWSFLAFGQAHAILVCFLQTLFICQSSYRYILPYSLKKVLFIWWRSSGATQEWPNREGRFDLSGFPRRKWWKSTICTSAGRTTQIRTAGPAKG